MSTQITIPSLNAAGVAAAIKGKKTYIALATGAAVIALNHYGLLPPDMAKSLNLDPANWLNDEYKLLLGATGRSALAGIEAWMMTMVFNQGGATGPGAKPGGAIGG